MTFLRTACLFFFILVFSGCSASPAEILPTAEVTFVATQTPFQPATIAPVSSQVVATPTPDSFAQYTISAMKERSYGGGEIEILEVLEENSAFTRYKIRYPSDGLAIYGFMNMPKGEGPFPVIVAIHGYADPNNYPIIAYSTDAVDTLTREGYIVIHPNMRGYGESDDGENPFRAGFAIDILNLNALVQAQGGQLGTLEKADPAKIGIWAHSMGGEIALRVLTVSDEVKATLLYSPMTGDIIKNAGIYYNLTGLPEFLEELNTPEEIALEISPVNYYENINSAIRLYHGTADAVILVFYSRETCQFLNELEKEIECTFYEGAKHTFSSQYAPDFQRGVLSFFDSYLK